MNANTIANALQAIKGGGALQLALPAQSDGKLVYFGSNNLPLVLNVPNDPNAGIKVGASLSGIGEEGLWYADGKPFVIRVAGTVTPITASGVLRLVLSLGNGVADPSGKIPGGVSDIVLLSTSATLPASSPYGSNFYLEARCIWDSTSSMLNGHTSGQISATLVDLAAISQVNVKASPLPFLIGCSLSLQESSGVQPVVQLTDFSAEML